MKVTLRRFAGNALELECSPEEFKLSKVEDFVGQITAMLDRSPVLKPLWLPFWDAVEEYPIEPERLDELIKGKFIPTVPAKEGIRKDRGVLIRRASLEKFMRHAYSRWTPEEGAIPENETDEAASNTMAGRGTDRKVDR